MTGFVARVTVENGRWMSCSFSIGRSGCFLSCFGLHAVAKQVLLHAVFVNWLTQDWCYRLPCTEVWLEGELETIDRERSRGCLPMVGSN